MKSRSKRLERRDGLTLVEVLLVLVILVVIGTLAATAIGPARERAFINGARTQISAFKTPLQQFRLDVGDFPSTGQGLEALRVLPSDLTDQTRWAGPYLDGAVPLDPWGNPYQYEHPGKFQADWPDIWSFGPDGIDNSDDDIGNWMEGQTQ
jgi:general secretion pathway protein G